MMAATKWAPLIVVFGGRGTGNILDDVGGAVEDIYGSLDSCEPLFSSGRLVKSRPPGMRLGGPQIESIHSSPQAGEPGLGHWRPPAILSERALARPGDKLH